MSDEEHTKRFVDPDDDETVAEVRPAAAAPQSTDAERRENWIGPYRCLHLLGEGGMGAVYLAEQLEPIRRSVALKVIRARTNSASVIARFEAERQALAIMDHPGIAKVLDAGVDDRGSPYFVMEYVAGAPIHRYCDEKRLTNRERIGLFVDTCMAIQHAHQKGIIHRDIKPTNILVTEVDGAPVPKVIDFGIAKATAEPLTESAFETHAGTLVGTPAYMSPEQASMSRDVDTRADVYALGVVLYQLLVGALPFEPTADRSPSFDDLRRRILEEDPEKPSTRVVTQAGEQSDTAAQARRIDRKGLHRQLRGDLDWIVLRALEKDRERRYQTANAVALDLQRHLRNEPVLAAAPSVAYRTAKFVRRHRAGVVAATFVVVALVAGLAAATAGFLRARSERDRALVAEREASQEASRANTISRFLTSMLASADPASTQGEEVTVREVLDRAADTVAVSFAGQPETEATVRETIASVYDSMGLYPQAAAHAARALELREAELGGFHRDTAAAVNQLAVVRFHQGDFQEAERLWRRTIEILAAVAGSESTEYLLALHNLGAVYLGQGRLDDAERLLAEAYAGRTRVLGEDHVQTLATMSNLAQCYDLQGRFDRAEPILRRVLEVRERELGDRHPRTIVAQFNLAESLAAQGRIEEARTLAARAEDGFRLVLGEQHPHTVAAAELVADLRVRSPHR